MPALYRPSSNGVFRISVALLFGALIGTPLVVMAYMRSPPVTQENNPIEQPVMFDHRHHVRDDGVECKYCHTTVDRSTYAGMPTTETCMGCHAQVWTESPLLEPVREAWREKKPIVWNRVHRLPDFVRFDHGSHVTKGVACETCHGRVDLMPYVHAVHPMQMGWCIDCHREHQARTDCSVCHQ